MTNTATALPVETLGRVCDTQYAAIPTDIWRHVVRDGVETGYIRREAGRPVGEIAKDITKKITRLVDEYATLGCDFKYAKGRDDFGHGIECPKFQRIACYAVTGGSEGHYVHVDLHILDGEGRDQKLVVKNLYLVKTFKGMKHARRIANRIADLLGV